MTRFLGPALKYSLTPALIPRVTGFFGSTFTNLAFLIAIVFNCVGILPKSHRYLDYKNKGTFGILSVVVESARHLDFRWKKIDQIIIFFAIILGLFLLGSQFLIIAGMALTGKAMASGVFNTMFSISPAQEQTDIAYRLLDMVFGVPGIFGNSAEGILPTFHSSLQGMYTLYSHAILVVASLILTYIVVTLIAETAQTGTPFGKRFNALWAPIRIVIGIGLIIPVAAGMNSGQWIALYAAKFGSNFATNGWLQFNSTLNGGYLGTDHMVGIPNTPELMHIPAFLMLAHSCDYSQEQIYGRNIDAYVVKAADTMAGGAIDFTMPYETALTFSELGNIVVRFGSREAENTTHKGFVRPYCGEIQFTTTTLDPTSGGFFMQRSFYQLIQNWWYSGAIPVACGGSFAGTALQVNNHIQFSHNYMRYFTPVVDRIYTEPTYSVIAGNNLPVNIFKTLAYNNFNNNVESCINAAAAIDRAGGVDPALFAYGWAGAGIWYNKIAESNGALGASAQAVPHPTLYPEIMEYVRDTKLEEDNNIVARTQYEPRTKDGRDISFPSPADASIAQTFYKIQQFWEKDGFRGDAAAQAHISKSNNRLIDAINQVLGTQGVFDMCKNTDVHPLAQLAITGRTLIENSIRGFGFAASSGAFGGLFYLVDPYAGAAGFAGAGFFSAIAAMGILVGFILYYVIPFMPFLYFFFAVGGWVKGLFEAMVGIPLWALAHIRMDGEGLPGETASDGYFLIFEIFFRPIMIVIGLIASILIFSAMVKVLNDTFFVVVSNLTGFNTQGAAFCGINNITPFSRIGMLDQMRGPIDEFFFTIVYAVIVYMIGMSCFKLIDNIPNSIMRWMAVSVATFNDKSTTDAGEIVQRVTVKGGMIGSSLQSAGQSLSEAGTSAGNLVVDSNLRDSVVSRFR